MGFSQELRLDATVLHQHPRCWCNIRACSVGNLQRPSLVLIDLDGTLVDSVPDLCEAANLMLAQLGARPLPEQQVKAYVGNGIERLIHRCLTGQLEGIAEATTYTQARDQFFKHYEAQNGLNSLLYPGVVEGINQLQNLGIALACITNKSARFSAPLLKHFDLLRHFEILVSGDTLKYQKPSPQPLLHAALELGHGVSQTLMVGDSIHDINAARAAKMPVVAVSYGYNHGQDIREANPDAVIEQLDQLTGLFPETV